MFKLTHIFTSFFFIVLPCISNLPSRVFFLFWSMPFKIFLSWWPIDYTLLFSENVLSLTSSHVKCTVLAWQHTGDAVLLASVKSQPSVYLTSLYWSSVFSLWIFLNSLCLWCSLSLQSRSCCRFLYIIILGRWCVSSGCILMFSITSGKLSVNMPLSHSVFTLWNSY